MKTYLYKSIIALILLSIIILSGCTVPTTGQEFQGNQLINKDFTKVSNQKSFVSTTTLLNGNVLIAYRDDGDNQYGNYVIVDQQGNPSTPNRFFESEISWISATTMLNGNVLIAFSDDDNLLGKYVIYDNQSNTVSSLMEFNSTQTGSISTTMLQNGNVLIAFAETVTDPASNNGRCVIMDQTGNVIHTPPEFIDKSISQTSATTLFNGNVLIAFTDGTNGLYLIVDQNGNCLSSLPIPTFTLGFATVISATTLLNGNVLIAFFEGGTGRCVIIDKLGETISNPLVTPFITSVTSFISTTPLLSGNALVIFKDDGATNKGKIIVVDKNGNANLLSIKNFETANIESISSTLLRNGSVLIAYGLPNSGKFVIYE